MAEKKNISNLEDIMEKTPRSSGKVSIDLTRPMDSIPTNEAEGAATEEKEVTMKAEEIQTGHIDSASFENMQTVEAADILPNKKEEPTAFENELFGKLDMAVEREKKNITERVDELTEMQKQEFEEQVKEVEDAKQKEEDDFALGTSSSTDEADSILGDDFEDDDTAITSVSQLNRVSISSSDDESVDIIGDPDSEENLEEATQASVVIDTRSDKLEYEPIDTIGEPKEVKEAVVIKKTEDVVEETKKPVSILSGINDSELFDDENEESQPEEDDTEKRFEDLKAEVKSKITPIRKSLDLSKFTIAKKSANASKVMKLAVQNHQCIADWVLYSAKRPISVTGLSGPEILKLNADNSTRNRLNTFRDIYRIIYDHIYDANKPEFETWLKQTRYSDIPHIYFALYMATFKDSNFITYSCDDAKCKKVFIKDVPFKDMVEYKDDEVKEKVNNILKMDTTSPSNDTYEVDLKQISDKYVFGLKNPSIWNVIIETASLSDAFIEKYSDLIDIVTYIDGIYVIDEESQQLIPVDTKPVPSDQAKTSARRIKIFHDIISSLSSEDFYSLRAIINEYETKDDEISYIIPAATCPDCAAAIPANKDMSPEGMLFTRHQLAAIANM